MPGRDDEEAPTYPPEEPRGASGLVSFEPPDSAPSRYETLAILGPDGAVVSRPGAVGPQVDPVLTTRVVPFNDLDALDAALGHGDVAALLMEPALTNIGIVLPNGGYHEAVREITRRHGVLLSID